MSSFLTDLDDHEWHAVWCVDRPTFHRSVMTITSQRQLIYHETAENGM